MSTPARTTHGHARRGAWTRTYTAWYSMKQRCLNPNTVGWARYGGRGIKVCEQWQSFERFLADMGEAPSAKHSLDRIDTDGDYAPNNCRWATKAEQDNNRSSCRYFEHGGLRLTVRQWADRSGIKYATLYRRLCLSGWPIDKALSRGPNHGHPETHP